MDNLKDRYDKDFTYGKVKFHLSSFIVLPEQSRFLLLKVIEQAVRDYMIVIKNPTPGELVIWESARDMIFDDSYRFNWGDWAINLEEALDMLDIDINWFREQTNKKYRKEHG